MQHISELAISVFAGVWEGEWIRGGCDACTRILFYFSMCFVCACVVVSHTSLAPPQEMPSSVSPSLLCWFQFTLESIGCGPGSARCAVCLEKWPGGGSLVGGLPRHSRDVFDPVENVDVGAHRANSAVQSGPTVDVEREEDLRG